MELDNVRVMELKAQNKSTLTFKTSRQKEQHTNVTLESVHHSYYDWMYCNNINYTWKFLNKILCNKFNNFKLFYCMVNDRASQLEMHYMIARSRVPTFDQDNSHKSRRSNSKGDPGHWKNICSSPDTKINIYMKLLNDNGRNSYDVNRHIFGLCFGPWFVCLLNNTNQLFTVIKVTHNWQIMLVTSVTLKVQKTP